MGDPVQVTIPFTGGLDEATAKQYIDPAGKQTVITNGEFVKMGAIDKRPGLEHLPNGLVPGSNIGAIADGVRVAGWSRSSIAACSGDGLYSFSEAQQGLVGVARIPNVYPTRTPITTAPSTDPPQLLDFPWGTSTLRMAVFYDKDFNLLATVTDLATQDVVLQPVLVFSATGVWTSGQTPILVSAMWLPNAVAGRQVCLVIKNQDPADANVYALNFDPSTNAFSSPTLLAAVSGVGAVGAEDAQPMVGDPASGFVVVYTTSTTTFNIMYFRPDFTATALRVVTLTAGQTMLFPIYVCANWSANGTDESVWVQWRTYQAPNYRQWYLQCSSLPSASFANTGPVLGPVNFIVASTTPWICSGICRRGANKMFLIVVNTVSVDAQFGWNTSTGWWYLFDSTVTALPGFGSMPLAYYPTLRPFEMNGEVYCACAYTTQLTASLSSNSFFSLQMTLYLMHFSNVDSGNVSGLGNTVFPVCTVAPRILDMAYQLYIFLFAGFRRPNMSIVDTSLSQRIACGLRTAGTDTSAQSGRPGPAWMVDFEFDRADEMHHMGELGSELSISGGVPFVADGNTAVEDGFFNYPEYAFVKRGGGSVSLAGQYVYAVVYSRIDAAGLKHQSEPVYTNAITPSSGGGVGNPILHILPVSATYQDVANPGTTYAEIYRTLSNGSTFYFVETIPISDTQANEVIWAPGGDSYSDSQINTASLLYTTGDAEQGNVNPPASILQVIHRTRKAIVDETGLAVWFSKEFEPGFAPGFNEGGGLRQEFPEGGRITALGSMDDKFLCFKYSDIFFMQGDGPSLNGQTSDWTVPQRISSDVGCDSPESVVTTPKGVIFLNPAGFYLLGRDLQVNDISRVVQDVVRRFPVCTSSRLVPENNQARWTMQNEAGDDSLVIVYDYEHNFWTTFDYTRLSAPIAAACVSSKAPQRYTLITTDGELWQEKLRSAATAYMDDDVLDASHFVETEITTAPVKVTVMGDLRARVVQFLGDRLDNCGLEVELQVNYKDTVVQTDRWYSDDLDQLDVPGMVQVEVDSDWTRCMAVSITVRDKAGSSMTDGRGMRFVALTVDLENVGPRYRAIPALGKR